jgi:hypothetical protein
MCSQEWTYNPGHRRTREDVAVAVFPSMCYLDTDETFNTSSVGGGVHGCDAPCFQRRPPCRGPVVPSVKEHVGVFLLHGLLSDECADSEGSNGSLEFLLLHCPGCGGEERVCPGKTLLAGVLQGEGWTRPDFASSSDLPTIHRGLQQSPLRSPASLKGYSHPCFFTSDLASPLFTGPSRVL